MPAIANGRPRDALSSSDDPGGAGAADRATLVQGDLVEIPQHLIDLTYEASTAKLPSLPPDDESLRPIAEEASDEDIGRHVSSTLLSQPEITRSLLVAEMVTTACAARQSEKRRTLDRLHNRQQSLPSDVPMSKSDASITGRRHDLGLFWINWSGLAFAALAAALGATILAELCYQVSGLRASSWGLVQDTLGALGFSWGFTLAVIFTTHWRRRTLGLADPHPLDRLMSAVAFRTAWAGLAGFGLMMGLMHSFEGGEGVFLPPLRCALTTASFVSLGMVCVVIEKGTERAFSRAYQATTVRNEQIEALDQEINSITTQLMRLDQIDRIAGAVKDRVKEHITAQQGDWLNRRKAIRSENDTNRKIAAEEQQVLMAEKRLAGLRVVGA